MRGATACKGGTFVMQAGMPSCKLALNHASRHAKPTKGVVASETVVQERPRSITPALHSHMLLQKVCGRRHSSLLLLHAAVNKASGSQHDTNALETTARNLRSPLPTPNPHLQRRPQPCCPHTARPFSQKKKPAKPQKFEHPTSSAAPTEARKRNKELERNGRKQKKKLQKSPTSSAARSCASSSSLSKSPPTSALYLQWGSTCGSTCGSTWQELSGTHAVHGSRQAVHCSTEIAS